MSFGSVFKSLRKGKGFTQEQLANLLSVTPQAISRWENNTAMPDISLLIPIANVFGVSTDTLLEVDVEKNNVHIQDLVKNFIYFKEPYGSTIEEKIALYESELVKFPDSIPLKEAMVDILLDAQVYGGDENRDELERCRRIISLSEDLIESGSESVNVSNYQSLVAEYSKKINNLQRAAELSDSATTMIASKEMLLPSALTGRAQVEARKDLIFKCADAIINTLYDMLDENSNDLSDEEYDAICKAENVISTLYGQSFSDHFILISNLYKGIRYNLSHQNIDAAMKRLINVVKRLELRNSEEATISPLVTDERLAELLVALVFRLNIKKEASFLLNKANDEFPNIGALREKNPEFDEAIMKLEALTESDGKTELNALANILWVKAQKSRNSGNQKGLDNITQEKMD